MLARLNVPENGLLMVVGVTTGHTPSVGQRKTTGLNCIHSLYVTDRFNSSNSNKKYKFV